MLEDFESSRCQASGTKDKAEAIRLAHAALADIVGGAALGTPVALLGPQSQWRSCIGTKLKSNRMTEHTAGNAEICIIRCWEILNELNGLTAWRQVTRPMVQPMIERLEKRGDISSSLAICSTVQLYRRVAATRFAENSNRPKNDGKAQEVYRVSAIDFAVTVDCGPVAVRPRPTL